MCFCGRSRRQNSNCQYVRCSAETIFNPVENIQLSHSVTTYPLLDYSPKPSTNNACLNDGTTFHNRCVSYLQSSNNFSKKEYDSATLFALSKEVVNHYKISLPSEWNCVSCELKPTRKYKFGDQRARPSELSWRKIAFITSALDNLIKNETAKEELVKMEFEVWETEESEKLEDEIMDFGVDYHTKYFDDEFKSV